MQHEEQEKPAAYTESIAEKDSLEKNSKFNEPDTTTVIRRSHVRVDLQAAGLGQRPPSVISSDQEYPPLEHKDIPIPSPYVKKMQQNQEISTQNDEVKPQVNTNVEENALIKTDSTKGCHNKISQDINQDHVRINSAITEGNQNVVLDNKSKSNIANERHTFSETVCQKTVSNAKNDQIKISVREKLAKNKEEVSGKRSSFVEVDNKVDQIEKDYLNTNQCSMVSSVQSTDNSPEKSINKETELDDAAHSENTSKFMSKTNNKKEFITLAGDTVSSSKSNSQTISNILNRSIEQLDQPQTTWEQEKQKAELAKLRLQENTSTSTVQQINIAQNVSPAIVTQQHIEKKQLNEHIVSESSVHDDSDSSDTKTVTNLEHTPAMDVKYVMEQNDSNTATENLSKVITNQIPVTPDTMTADEAENLLSSR